jgi:hypothetical protein
MRSLLLLSLTLCAFAVDETPRVEPTKVDRIQGTTDPATGKFESLQIWDVNEAVDAVGTRRQIGERSTVITRADFPNLFDRLDAIIDKTAQRDAAHKAKKAAAAAVPAP